MATMDDLIATISGGMHVGQTGNDLKQLQAHLSQTLYQPHIHSMSATGFKANPPSRSTSCSRPQYINNEPAAPPSSYTNSFAPSSFPAYPSPMIQTDSSDIQTPKPSRPPVYGRQASYGFPSTTTSLPASPKSHALPHHSVLPAPGTCDDAETSAAFGDDAFAPLHQNQHQHQSSWGAFHQHQQKAAVADPWAAFGGATSSVSAASSAINVRQASDDDMDMDDEDEDCVEQQMGGWRSAPQPIFGHQQAVGGWDQRGRF